MCSLSSQSDATCFTAHLEAAASLPLEKKQQIKKNNPQTKPSATAGWFKRSGLLPRADAGLGLLLGILLLSLLGAVLAGLFLLLAALVLFVLVTPMTLPLLALVLLAARGEKGEKKVTPEPASAQQCQRDPTAPAPRHARGQSALVSDKQERSQVLRASRCH